MVSGFVKKKVGTMTLGEKLQRLRTEKRMSLNEVSRCTRVKMAYLEYLEEGDYGRLPADVYVKGFLRSYAEFLGVDEAILIRLYEKERGIKRNLERSKNPPVSQKKSERVNVSSFVFTPKRIIFFATAVLALGGFFYLYKIFGSFSGAPQLVILTPAQNEQVDTNSIVIEGITDNDASLFINSQPILINDDGRFREDLTLQSGVNVINVRSVNKFNKEEKKILTVQSNYKEKEGDNFDGASGGSDNNSGLAQINDQSLQLELRVDPGPVWVSVETDGNVVFSGTMLTGAVQSFKANEKIVVNSGKGNATMVKFNGKDIGTLSSDSGAARGVTFTKDTKY